MRNVHGSARRVFAQSTQLAKKEQMPKPLDIPPGCISAVVLGTLQDAGLPHIGCRCPRCSVAQADPRLSQYAACLAIVDRRREPAGVWLIDATPDIRWQLDALAPVLGPHPVRGNRLRQPNGILLTHAHMGHIGGLPQLGPEGMAVETLPVIGLPSLLSLLRDSPVWRPLSERLAWQPIEANVAHELAPGLTVLARPVPHRDEWGAGTVACEIRTADRSLLYVPDIDAWERWPEARATVSAIDIALVDASFYSADELGGRPPVAHPLVPDTLAFFGDLAPQLLLTHLNHTNPVLDANSLERQRVLQAGCGVAVFGQVIAL